MSRLPQFLARLGGSLLFAAAILSILCGGQVVAWAIGGAL